MHVVLSGIVLTYVVAPLAAYCLIAPAYRLPEDKPFNVLVVAMGFEPIGISLLLFALFTIAPGQSDLFYVGVVVVIILLPLTVRWRWLKSLFVLPPNLLRARAHLGRELLSTSVTDGSRNIFSGVTRMIPIIIALLLFLSFVNELRPGSTFRIYGLYNVVAIIVGIVLVLVASTVFIREAIAVTRGVPGATQRTFLRVSQIAEDNLAVLFGAALTIILLTMVLHNGLTVPLVGKDPIEYALMSRAIYAAKSLSIYPITELADSGLYSGSSHPPAYYLLQVWGYIFDGPNATRLLRLSPLFYFVGLIILMSTVLMRYGKLAAVLGGLFILSIPFLQYLAAMSHIDPMRIYFFFLSLVLVADIIRHPTLPRTIVCGVAIGFALYSHSLGAISAIIAGGSYLLLDKRRWRDRLVTAGVLGIVGGIVSGTQYVKNFINFGMPLLEYEPVWQIPELHEAADLAQRRMLGSPLDMIVNGIFRTFTDIAIYGPISAVALVLILARVRVLWRGDLTRVMLVACCFFFVMVIAVTLAGSLSAIKNPRYMMTIVPVLCFLAAVAFSDLANKWGPLTDATAIPSGGAARRRIGPYFRSQGYVLIFMVLVVAWTVPYVRSFASYSRPSLVWQARDADFVYDPALHLGPMVRYFIDRPAGDGKALVFRQAEFAFYGRYPWIDYLNPALVEFYKIKDKRTAYYDLLRRGIKYLFVAYGDFPTAYYNSQTIEITADQSLAEIVAVDRGGSALFRLRDEPERIPCYPVTPHTFAVEYQVPGTFLYVVRRILREARVAANDATPAVRREEFRFENPVQLTGTTHVSQFDSLQLSAVEFGGIDVALDAPSQEAFNGLRRIHIGLDLEGEGMVEIAVAAYAGGLVTFAQANAEPKPGKMSLWGLLASFDDDGNLFYLGEKVGQVVAIPKVDLLKRAFEGEPVTIKLDERVCTTRDLGALQCHTPYEGRYEPATNRWTLTGPIGLGPNSVTEFGVWTGLLNGGVRRVNVQTKIPPYATWLKLVVHKYNKDIGSLAVRGIDLCRFQETHLLPEK